MADNGADNPAHTPLHNLHLEQGAKMVPFAGYQMPLNYGDGIIKEHSHTRSSAGLFDVSHMGQIRLSGPSAATALESLVPVDVVGLGAYRQRYALFTNDTGGILDDLMVTNTADHLFVVVNAARKDHDIKHLLEHLGSSCEINVLSDHALLALQGPQAATVMMRLAPPLAELTFMTAAHTRINGADCLVTRSGYTGEDGFEISLPAEKAESLARLLLAQEEVKAIGLGARDSLRLEAGLCLYGHDIDTTTTPVEANLTWALSKVRRGGGARAGGYPGADVIFEQLDRGTKQKRVGIRPEGKAPVREGVELAEGNCKPVGRVTSGGYGPTIGGPVAMGYVGTELSATGTELQAMVRGKSLPVRVVKLPFVAQRYYRG